MSCPPPLPDGWFGLPDRKPVVLNLVKAPASSPCDADPFPFRLAVLIATLVLGAGAVGARYWLLPAFLASEPEVTVPVVQVVHAERRVEEVKPLPMRRVEPGQPFAPRVPVAVPIPAVQPELVEAELEERIEEPYDPTDILEEADLPFPPAKEEPPKVVKQTPKKTVVEKTRRPKARPSSRPKPAAKGPSRPVRVLRRYQPPYPRSARRAGAEGRVMLSVQIRSDGRVGSVRVASSSGSAVLDSAAISAVKRWSFAPEEKNGKPVPSRVNVPFRFSLK